MIDFTHGLPVLQGERVRLRQLTAGDAADVFEIFSDPEVMKYWSSAPMQRIDDAHELLAEIEQGWRSLQFLQWGITIITDDRVAGTCTLYRWDRAHRRAELGFALRRSLWGRGLISEAVNIVVRFAFDEMNLHRLEADVDPANTASIRILKRLGFRDEGLLRERYLTSGVAQDALFMGLLKSERILS